MAAIPISLRSRDKLLDELSKKLKVIICDVCSSGVSSAGYDYFWLSVTDSEIYGEKTLKTVDLMRMFQKEAQEMLDKNGIKMFKTSNGYKFVRA